MKKIDGAMKITDDEFDKLIVEFSEKDEHGKPLPIEGGRPGSFRIAKESEAEFEEKAKLVADVEVDLPSFTMTELEVVGSELTPAHYGAIEPLIGTIETI
jgi:hypothetical protein